jgi:hypothetical protein
MAPVTTSSDKNEESKKEDTAASITFTQVLSPDTLDRYGRLQDALRNFDKDYQSLNTPLMDTDQDGEPPFDTDVALEILLKRLGNNCGHLWHSGGLVKRYFVWIDPYPVHPDIFIWQPCLGTSLSRGNPASRAINIKPGSTLYTRSNSWSHIRRRRRKELI